MVETKKLLQPSDIRTMTKDIRQLRKTGFLQKPKEKTETAKKEVLREQLPKKETQERELMENILEEAVKQRQELKKEQSKVENTTEQPNEAGTINKEVSSQQQSAPLKTEEKEWMKKIPEPAKEKFQSAAKTEQERRRKFMEDIEKWAQGE